MKKHFHSVLLLLCLSIMAFSCGGRHNSSEMPGETTESLALDDDSWDLSDADSLNSSTIKPASVNKMRMVLDKSGNVVGRYVSSNEDTYTVCVQNNYEVPKAGHSVAVFSAANKQGILYTKRTHVNIRQLPTTESTVVTQISYKKGSVPETYPCIGKVNEWYKIRVNGKEGYVRQDLVIWDGMDSF